MNCMRTLAVAVWLPLLAALSGAEPAMAQETARARADARVDGRHVDGGYRIGPEDVLDIAVWNNTPLSRTVPVRPDGKISLPLLNDVQAAGLTPSELREVLEGKLVTYMPNPEVSVIVREVRSFKVAVIGEVRRPDRYELRSRATVLDVLSMAGGFTEFAARTRVVVLRHDGAGMKRVPFNYNAIISADGEHHNFLLQPGDIVVVP